MTECSMVLLVLSIYSTPVSHSSGICCWGHLCHQANARHTVPYPTTTQVLSHTLWVCSWSRTFLPQYHTGVPPWTPQPRSWYHGLQRHQLHYSWKPFVLIIITWSVNYHDQLHCSSYTIVLWKSGGETASYWVCTLWWHSSCSLWSWWVQSSTLKW